MSDFIPMSNFTAPLEPPPRLAEGWVEQWCDHWRRSFYVNLITMTSQWELPIGSAAGALGGGNGPPNHYVTNESYVRDQSSGMPPAVHNLNRPDGRGVAQGYGQPGIPLVNTYAPIPTPAVQQQYSGGIKESHSGSSSQQQLYYQNAPPSQQQYYGPPQPNAQYYPQQEPHGSGVHYAQPDMQPQREQPGGDGLAGGAALGGSPVVRNGQGYNTGAANGGGSFGADLSYPWVANR